MKIFIALLLVYFAVGFVLLLSSLFGCGNAGMKELNPNGGTITLYSANGSVIASYLTDGEPEMHEGGHIYCRDKVTGRLVICYGTYTFVKAP
jgi:hypothetical protein